MQILVLFGNASSRDNMCQHIIVRVEGNLSPLRDPIGGKAFFMPIAVFYRNSEPAPITLGKVSTLARFIWRMPSSVILL